MFITKPEADVVEIRTIKIIINSRCVVKVPQSVVSKFGKLSSGHRTGKGQFSFQSQRKAMPKDVQTTAQLHSSHMLVNFQMFKLDLEKAEEPEIKLSICIGS